MLILNLTVCFVFTDAECIGCFDPVLNKFPAMRPAVNNVNKVAMKGVQRCKKLYHELAGDDEEEGGD